jgi:hypothetical protein
MRSDRGPQDLSRLIWRTSSYSTGAGQCVQVAELSDGGRAVRDSKNPGGQPHFFALGEWDAFVKGVRAGASDL